MEAITLTWAASFCVTSSKDALRFPFLHVPARPGRQPNYRVGPLAVREKLRSRRGLMMDVSPPPIVLVLILMFAVVLAV